MKRLLSALLIAVAALALTVTIQAKEARADGCYIPEKAYQKLPEIPTQRAIVRFKDGEEKLTIESSLDAEGQSFGWILPVPAEPTEVKEATAGLMDSFTNVMQPDIRHDRGREGHLDIWTLIWVGIWALVIILWLPRARIALIGMLVLAGFGWYGFGFFVFGCGSMGSMVDTGLDTPGVNVSSSDIVGNYEVTVLDADNPGALNAWLEQGGFSAVPQKGEAIVQDYIDDGWHFVLSKLRKEGGGLCTPHPLAVTFPAEEPVYPMRLTELAGSELFLDLFVIADGAADGRGMEKIYSDTYDESGIGHNNAHYSGQPDPRMKGVTYPSMRGYQKFGGSIGHPDAVWEMWNRCSVTRLQGKFKPGGDWSDIPLTVGYPEPYRAVYYSDKWARQTADIVFCRGVNIALPFTLFVLWGFFRNRGWRGRLAALAACAVVLAAGGLAHRLTYRSIPTIPVTTSRHYDRFPNSAYRYKEVLSKVPAAAPGFETMSPSELKIAVGKAFDEAELTSSKSGEPHGWGDSPGQWLLYEDRRGVMFRFHGPNGLPEDVPFRMIPEEERAPLPKLSEAPDDVRGFLLKYYHPRSEYYFQFKYLNRHRNYFRVMQGYPPEKGPEPGWLDQEVTALLRKDGMCLARRETRLVGGGKELCFWSAKLDAWYPLKYALQAVEDGDNFQDKGPREEIAFNNNYYEVIVFTKEQAVRNRCRSRTGRSMKGSDLRAAMESLIKHIEKHEPFWKGPADAEDMPQFEILGWGTRLFEDQLRWTLDGDESARYNDLDFALLQWEKQPGFGRPAKPVKEGENQ